MAIDTVFTVRGQQKGWPEFNFPTSQFKIADVSVSSTQVAAAGQGDCGTGMFWFRAAIYQKNAVPSTIPAVSGASKNLVYQLEVSPVVGFTAGMTRVLGQASIDRTTSSRGSCIIGPCQMADAANASGYQFVRVTVLTPTGDAVSFDTIIEAC